MITYYPQKLEMELGEAENAKDTNHQNTGNRKMQKFEIEGGLNHHNCLQESYLGQMKWWENEISCGNRCRKCWLRPVDCFCATLNKQMAFFDPLLKSFSKEVNVMIYYHYLEISRSPNTCLLYTSDAADE